MAWWKSSQEKPLPGEVCILCAIADEPLSVYYVDGQKKWTGRRYITPMIRVVYCEKCRPKEP